MQTTIEMAPGVTSTTTKLLIGNLPESIRPAALKDIFSPIGIVLSISIVGNGFAIVEMSAPDADSAVIQLRGRRIDGHAMMLDEINPRTPSRY